MKWKDGVYPLSITFHFYGLLIQNSSLFYIKINSKPSKPPKLKIKKKIFICELKAKKLLKNHKMVKCSVFTQSFIFQSLIGDSQK